MQRSSTTLTAATALVLLASTSLATTAQELEAGTASDTDESLPPYAAITGRAVLGHQVGSFDTIRSEEPPRERWRGWTWTGRYEVNDPRLACDFIINQNGDFFESGWSGGMVRSGIGRCENDGGYWTFESIGFTKPGVSITDGNYYAQVFTGHEGYEGLSALLIVIPSPGHQFDIEGVIAPGPLPEPPTSLPPAE